jgi:hypothetical protein
MPNGCNGQPEVVRMAFVVMEPALAAQRLFFMLRCAWRARHGGLYEKWDEPLFF